MEKMATPVWLVRTYERWETRLEGQEAPGSGTWEQHRGLGGSQGSAWESSLS